MNEDIKPLHLFTAAKASMWVSMWACNVARLHGLSTPVIRRPGRLSGYQYIEYAPALRDPHDILSMWARVARIAPRDLRGYNENTIVTAGVSISDEVWW